MFTDYKTLVVASDLNGPGGITHHFRALNKFYGPNVEYLAVGRRYGRKRAMPYVIRLFADYIIYLFKIQPCAVVHLNPSLCRTCFFREVIFILMAKLFRKKIVVQFHGWDIHFQQQVDRNWQWLFRAVWCRAGAMLVLAKDFKDQLERWGYKGPIYTETTAMDESLVPEVLAAREKTGSRDLTRLHAIYLARVEKTKGVYESVDAVGRMPADEIHLTLGGNGSDYEDLKTYVKSRGYKNIDLPGYLSGTQKTDIFAAADVFLFPSYYGEGLPVCILEAMAVGLPVITCAVGGIGDFFEDNTMGILVPPQDVPAIQKALIFLRENPEKRLEMGRYNAEYARQRFYAANVAARMEAIYTQVMGR